MSGIPQHEEHCQHSLKRYGIRGDDIHSYIDEPSKSYSQSHRQYRHDSNTVKLVGEMFGRKYGRELAENIALDHIMADHEEEVKNRNSSNLTTNERIRFVEKIERDSRGFPVGWKHPVYVNCPVCRKEVPKDFPLMHLCKDGKFHKSSGEEF